MGRAGSSARQRAGEKINLSLWDGFLEARSWKTGDNYRRAVRQFCESMGFQSPEDMAAKATQEHIMLYVRMLRDRGIAASHIRLQVAALKAFLSLYRQDISWFFLRSLLPRKRTIRENPAVPREVVKQVLPLLSPTRRLVVWLLWGTGLRLGEALSLRKNDFDLDADPPRLNVVSEKTGVPRTVFIPGDLANALRPHLEKLSDDDFVFHARNNPKKPLLRNKVRASFQSALNRLGHLKRDRSGKGWNYTLHGLRRSYKTYLTTSGMNQMFLMLLMGHDVGVSAAYLKPSVEALAEEWKKFEHVLRLDYEPKQVEEKTIVLKALEAVWNALNPNQPAEDLYQDAVRFTLNRQPTIDEKVLILQEAIRSFTQMARGAMRREIRSAFEEARMGKTKNE
ncbi:MAG: site-specific integrase [Candidatus Caldarchaeum sp.]